MEDTALVDTSTASTPSSSPTTSTPASEPTIQSTTDRPSFGEALDTFNEAAKAQGKRPRGLKPASSPVESVAPAGAAIAPTDPTVAQQSPPVKTGFVATADHIQAVDNARTKTRVQVEQEFRSQFGDPQVVRDATQWFQSAARDRVGFLATVINEALADPELGPQVLSLAGRTLSGSRSAAPQGQDPPAPDFTDGQGNQFYSAKTQQQRDEWLIAKVRGEVLGAVQPDLDQFRATTAKAEAAEASAQLKQTMTGHLQEARAWPYFADHEAEIKQALLNEPLTSGHPAEEAWLLRRVYDRIVGPKLSSLEQARVVAELKKLAHSSTLNPAATGAPTGVPKTVRAKDGGSFGNALRWAAAQAEGR